MTDTAEQSIGQTIRLQNPVAQHYEAFIIGTAVAWQVRALIDLEDSLPPEEFEPLKAEFMNYRPGAAFGESVPFHDAALALGDRYVVQHDEAKGQHLVLCGAGPSLRKHARDYCRDADQVWGCNSALTWLLANGYRATHGFTVDQTPAMVNEWRSTPDVEYIIPSTVHPHVMDLLRAAERRWRLFHNYVGIKQKPVAWDDGTGKTQQMGYEEWLYALLFPTTVVAGSGLNTVPRAIDVAQFMGFEKITVIGADCSIQVRGKPRHDLPFRSAKHLKWLRKHTVMHADGGHALASDATPLTLGGYIDKRYWMTKADLAITAQWLVRMTRASNGQIKLIGDTLPNALMDKDDAFLARMPNFVLPDGTLANIPVFNQAEDHAAV